MFVLRSQIKYAQLLSTSRICTRILVVCALHEGRHRNHQKTWINQPLLSRWYAVDFYCTPEELDTLASAFGACTEKLCAWMRSTRLKVNCKETDCIWLCTKQRQKTLSAPALHVGDATIQPTSGARNHGVFLWQPSWPQTAHLKRMSIELLSTFATARRVTITTTGVLWTLLYAFVSCRLDYCNSLMAGLPLCDITAFAVSP